ncbi:Cof subfamily protein (haloacid dehalogenase superfamily) [Streptacidiphilus sp. MAP12-16]|uniref:HAD family hydrolase n=1 Tax=Streptacidiphilus sp. MAP12-16 TaxID=3156300 RepID=UPI0035157CC0
MNPPPHPPVRLIATDLDGTLLRSDGTVSARTQAALTLAEDAGLCIVFVTGRPPRWMESLSEHTGPHGVAICSNGGAVYDVRRKELVESFPLRAEDALAVVEALRRELPGVSFAFEYPSGFSHEPDYTSQMWGSDGVQRIAPAEEILGAADAHTVFKILAKHPDLDPDEMLRRACLAAGDLAEITRSSPMLEISATGVSKATTLARWCADRGIAAEEVVAFGDMPNDLPMLAWAGTAYAVANAHPQVLAATPGRAGDHDEDGVAEVIEKLVASL